MSSDAQIAREWAEKISVREKITFSVDDETLAAARHILATTTPPTMADIAWDDAVHAGLCAEDETLGLVRVLGKLPSGGIVVTTTTGHTWCSVPDRLTPIPGTKVDLTPSREPKPESTSDHPTVLTTEEDYESAPAGTVVAESEETPWMKRVDGLWEHVRYLERDDCDMSARSRRVLRWEWGA